MVVWVVQIELQRIAEHEVVGAALDKTTTKKTTKEDDE